MKQTLSKNELDLIRKWQENESEDIALYFFNKYKSDITNIIYSKINIKFSSIPLDKEDFFHLVWKSVLNTLKDYKFQKNGSFRNLLIRKAYLSSVKEAVKFLRNNHLVLNNSYSYETLLSNQRNYKLGENLKTNINSNFNLARESFVDEVVSFNNKYKVDFLKKIIYLRSLGYTEIEISKKVRRPITEIREVLNFICDIAKKLYY